MRPAPHWPLPRDSPVVSTLRYVRAGGTWLSRPHVAFPRARLSASAPSKSRGAGGRTSTCYKPSARRSISRSRSAVSSPAAPAAASCKKRPCSAALPQAGAEHMAASWRPWPSVSAAAAFAQRGGNCATACRGAAGRRGGGAAWASRHARRCSGAWQWGVAVRRGVARRWRRPATRRRPPRPRLRSPREIAQSPGDGLEMTRVLTSSPAPPRACRWQVQRWTGTSVRGGPAPPHAIAPPRPAPCPAATPRQAVWRYCAG